MAKFLHQFKAYVSTFNVTWKTYLTTALDKSAETAQQYKELIVPVHKCRFANVITHKNRSALIILFVLDAQSTEQENGSQATQAKSDGAPNCMNYSSANVTLRNNGHPKVSKIHFR